MTPSDRTLLTALTYRFEVLCPLAGAHVVRVTNPDRPASDYVLRQSEDGWTCSCPAHALHGDCKHLSAWLWRGETVARLQAQERARGRERRRAKREAAEAVGATVGGGWNPGEEW